MSKFIQTQCGSLVNVDSISSIQQDKKNVKDSLVLIKFIITDNNNQEFVYNSSYFDYSIQQDEKYVSGDSFCTFTLYEIVNFINSNIDYVLNSNVNYNLKPRKNWNLLIKKATKK